MPTSTTSNRAPTGADLFRHGFCTRSRTVTIERRSRRDVTRTLVASMRRRWALMTPIGMATPRPPVADRFLHCSRSIDRPSSSQPGHGVLDPGGHRPAGLCVIINMLGRQANAISEKAASLDRAGPPHQAAAQRARPPHLPETPDQSMQRLASFSVEGGGGADTCWSIPVGGAGPSRSAIFSGPPTTKALTSVRSLRKEAIISGQDARSCSLVSRGRASGCAPDAYFS